MSHRRRFHPLPLHCDPRYFERGLVLGISGGIDSVVLLHRCIAVWKNVGKGPLIPVHVNYGLRPQADEDQHFVEQLATAYGHPAQIYRAPRAPDGANIQAWARTMRYNVFQAVAETHRCAAVAVAHHADDQIETLLWHLLRGTGLDGLVGMVAVRPLTATIDLYRPFLSYRRADLMSYAREHDLSFRDDLTNSGDHYTRGRIRHELLPLCESIHAGAGRHMAALATSVAPDALLLRTMAQTAWETMATPCVTGVSWERTSLLALAPALRPRVLSLAYRKAAGTWHHVGSDQLRRMQEILERGRGTYHLPQGITFECHRGVCRIRKGPLRFLYDRAKGILATVRRQHRKNINEIGRSSRDHEAITTDIISLDDDRFCHFGDPPCFGESTTDGRTGQF
ncbi:MAG: tRNA lysidine(34) synthetase TilS [Deltaproteobacteria bacterium]|nr:tRNA lysidine(34) synthetase TilS [Deltaproteobacteria bacterium]